MTDRIFPSKVDGWLIPLLLITFVGMTVALVAVMVEPAPWAVRLLVGVVVVALTLMLVSVLRNTRYVVGETELRVVSGPFKWTIPIADIVDVTPSRNPLSSPALSLDRLKVRFGKNKFLLVSPADKDGFRHALEQARQGSRK